MAKLLDISEVAKQSGLAASTLRFYEEKGLIRAVARRGLRRQYESQVLQQLGLIALGRSAGFALDEIAQMVSPDGTRIDRDQLRHKAELLDEQIKRLTAMRNGLLHAIDCKAPSHLECPSFQRLIRLASKGHFAAKD